MYAHIVCFQVSGQAVTRLIVMLSTTLRLSGGAPGLRNIATQDLLSELHLLQGLAMQSTNGLTTPGCPVMKIRNGSLLCRRLPQSPNDHDYRRRIELRTRANPPKSNLSEFLATVWWWTLATLERSAMYTMGAPKGQIIFCIAWQ